MIGSYIYILTETWLLLHGYICMMQSLKLLHKYVCVCMHSPTITVFHWIGCNHTLLLVMHEVIYI